MICANSVSEQVSSAANEVEEDDPDYWFKFFMRTPYITGMYGIFFYVIFTFINASVFRLINALGKEIYNLCF